MLSKTNGDTDSNRRITMPRIVKCPLTNKLSNISDCLNCPNLFQIRNFMDRIECEIDWEKKTTQIFDSDDPALAEI
jgi:hypothetical protein